MRFQERDNQILFILDNYGGVLARRHLKAMFWPDASQRAMLKRISLLVEHGYLARPSRFHWKTEPIPEAIYWIGWRGAMWLAEQRGIEVDPPKNKGENQMRGFHRSLRERGMRWMREPKWSKLKHDLLSVDFRLVLETSLANLPSLSLEQWIQESEFRSKMDRVEYRMVGKNGKVEQGQRGVCPDGFFVIADERRRATGEPHRLSCLLEVDMATHDNPSFGREKAAPYAAYLKSQAFKARFGLNTGVWLILTSGERRLQNLMRQTEGTIGQDANRFFFTCFSDLQRNILADPIWRQAGRDQPVVLIS